MSSVVGRRRYFSRCWENVRRRKQDCACVTDEDFASSPKIQMETTYYLHNTRMNRKNRCYRYQWGSVVSSSVGILTDDLWDSFSRDWKRENASDSWSYQEEIVFNIRYGDRILYEKRSSRAYNRNNVTSLESTRHYPSAFISMSRFALLNTNK